MYIDLGSNFEIFGNKTNLINDLPLHKIKVGLLGREYSLSLIFHSPQSAQKMNIKYRDKKYIPNILTFEIDDKAGEIYICLSEARKQHKDFDLNYREYLILLFIHGILHIKGLEHNTDTDNHKMSEMEFKLLNKYK